MLGGAAFAAGLVDAVAGGGRLVLVPALFSAFPEAPPARLLGTNKIAGIVGTVAAGLRYRRAVEISWRTVAPMLVAAFLASLAGAFGHQPGARGTLVRQALPVVLALLFLYTLLKPNLGAEHKPHLSGWREAVVAVLTGVVLGFYDGLFGPGTGSFLMFAFVRIFGFDFLNASASTKLVNVATNFAAILLFAVTVQLWWRLGLTMAVANLAGSQVGSWLAIRHGSGFVRKVFLVVVLALLVKTAKDAFGHLYSF